MTIQNINSFVTGSWIPSDDNARMIFSAITGEPIACAGNDALDAQEVLDFGRKTGGAALRAMTFHDRARMLKALAQFLGQNKQVLYDLSFDTGATQTDNMIDVDGGIGTLFVYASKGRSELPDAKIYLDGILKHCPETAVFWDAMWQPPCKV